MVTKRTDKGYTIARREELMQEGRSDIDISKVISEELNIDDNKLYQRMRQWVRRKTVEPNDNNQQLNPRSEKLAEMKFLEYMVLEEAVNLRTEDEDVCNEKLIYSVSLLPCDEEIVRKAVKKGIEDKVLEDKPYERLISSLSLLSYDEEIVKKVVKKGIEDKVLEDKPFDKEGRNQKIYSRFLAMENVTPYTAGKELEGEFTDELGNPLNYRSIEHIIIDKGDLSGRSQHSRKTPKEVTQQWRDRYQELVQKGCYHNREIYEMVAKEMLPSSNKSEVDHLAFKIKQNVTYHQSTGRIPKNPN